MSANVPTMAEFTTLQKTVTDLGVSVAALKTSLAGLTSRVATLEAVPILPPPPPVLTGPGMVTDLSAGSSTTGSVALTFTEVSDGAGGPANYDIRYAAGTIGWATAQSTAVVGGLTIGAKRTVVIAGLAPATVYQFQLVAYRGTLDVNAVFGALSNVASGATLGIILPPPPPPPLSGSWPNEPAGFRLLNDQPWDLLTGSGWNWLRRAASINPSIAFDALAPQSPPNVLQMVFTPDMGSDNEPSVHWIPVPGLKEIYTGWLSKLSSNWVASPAGAGKITFLFAGQGGQVYTGYYHKGGDVASGWIPGPPYRIGVNMEWAPYGQMVLLPNVATTFCAPGEWHRVEVYYKWETVPGVSGDGIIRWWVDGVLNGNYTNIHYPATSFTEFQYAATLQNPPPVTQYMYVDHTHVSVP